MSTEKKLPANKKKNVIQVRFQSAVMLPFGTEQTLLIDRMPLNSFISFEQGDNYITVHTTTKETVIPLSNIVSFVME